MGRVAAMTRWLSGFTTQIRKVDSKCESMHCVIHREMLASHLNLTMFGRMWLKLSTILKYMPLTHVSACSSVRRWMQSTHILSYMQKWGGFLKVDHWLEFWIMITSRDSFKKQSPLAAHFSDVEWVQSLLVCVTYTTCTVNSICHFRRGQKLCKSQQIKWLHSRQTGNMGIMSEHWDLAHFKH